MQRYYIISLLNGIIIFRSSRLEVFLQISQNSQESTCARVSFLINFIKKETLVHVFSCEFCKIFKNAEKTSSGCFCIFAIAGLIKYS